MNTLTNVVGQDRAKNILELVGRSYQRRGALPPLGIFGPSGLGKTHLVEAFSNWLGARLIYINGTAIRDAMAFRGHIKEAGETQREHFVMFIDECHNLPRKVQENMLSMLEKPAKLCTISTKDQTIRTAHGPRHLSKGDVLIEDIPDNISFVLATTDVGMLKDTILNRLRKIHLEPYTLMQKAEIARRHLDGYKIEVNIDIAKLLANRARNIRHLKSDICETYIDIVGLYSDHSTDDQLAIMDEMLGMDSDGATEQDLDYMRYIAQHSIAGLDTLAGILRIDRREIQYRIEPFLMEKGWIYVTGKGRRLSDKGLNKMMIKEDA